MKQYNSLYSVIIPVYNGIDFIERCLYDHVKQSLLPQIIIIVDDGSSDDQKISNSLIILSMLLHLTLEPHI